MPHETLLTKYAGARLTAAAVVGLTSVVAFTAPASADPVGIDDVNVNHVLPLQIVRGEAPEMGVVEVEYTPTPGYEDSTHWVTVELEFDGTSGSIDIEVGDGCETGTGTWIHCTEPQAGPYLYFDFDLSAPTQEDDEDETYPYTLSVIIDGQEVANESGELDILSGGGHDRHSPYLLGDTTVTDVAPGTTTMVTPTFHQERNLHESAAAVVARFSDAFGLMGIGYEGAEALADYDNCTDSTDDIRGGVVCLITDFTDQPGTPLTFTGPVGYAIAADAAGPLEACRCYFSVNTVDSAAVEEQFGDLTWDEDSENLLGLETADSWTPPADPDLAEYYGAITVVTSEHQFDLEVGGAVFEGTVGDQVQVTVPVTNHGPAALYDYTDGHGRYAVRAQLPEGTELVAVDSDAGSPWRCFGEEALPDLYDRDTDTALDHFDLSCHIDRFSPGQKVDFTFTVTLTGEAVEPGLIEVDDPDFGGYADTLDADPSNNLATLTNAAEQLTASSNDYNGDGVQDLIVVRESDGALRLHPGTSDGTLEPGSTIATGWGGVDVVMAGDLTGDGDPDLLARDTKSGALYTYPGDGVGGFDSRLLAGTGWNKMGGFTALDHDTDGLVDILAVRESDGGLYMYPGNGDGTFKSAFAVGSGADMYDMILAPGDVDGDGTGDYMLHYGPNQEYHLVLSGGEGPVVLQPSLGDPSASKRYRQVAAVGDLDRDGLLDLVAVDSRTGELTRQSFDEYGDMRYSVTTLGTGWGGMRLPTAIADRTYDYDQDGAPDLVARHGSTGTTYLYTTTGTGGFDSRVSWGSDFEGMNLLVTAGDFTGDGLADVIGRVGSTGALHVYPGDGYGGYDHDARVQIGTGWNKMSAIVSGHDFDGDGRVDIIAREQATGYLWLYPGTATGKVASRVQIGTGWNAMSAVTAAGDLDHDGHADLIAVRNSDGCMYFYGGRGDGSWKSAVKVGCGWGAVDAIAAIGDFDADGHPDLLARRGTDGRLFAYPGDGNGGFGSSTAVGTGWNAMDLIA